MTAGDDIGGRWAVVVTERLRLTALTPDDTDDLFAISGDARTWTHAPEGRHADASVTADWIERARARWFTDGLSYWMVRLLDSGAPAGVGGVQRQSTGAWNLFYRFAPEQWGKGLATELSRAAIEAAHTHDPDAPVIARILAHNDASRRVADRLGLTPDGPFIDPSDGKRRLRYADRPLPPG